MSNNNFKVVQIVIVFILVYCKIDLDYFFPILNILLESPSLFHKTLINIVHFYLLYVHFLYKEEIIMHFFNGKFNFQRKSVKHCFMNCFVTAVTVVVSIISAYSFFSLPHHLL